MWVLVLLLLVFGLGVPAVAQAGPDLALNRPVLASATESCCGNVPAKAVDDDPTTRWSSPYS